MQIQIGLPDIPPSFPLWLVVLVLGSAVLIALFRAITEWQITERTKAALAGLQSRQLSAVSDPDRRLSIERDSLCKDERGQYTRGLE
jgi:hypothetical protein